MSALLLVAVAALVALNGFFVAAEFALVRARRSRVEALASERAPGAGLALHQIDRIDEYLSACQLGITMASLGIGFLGEPAIARLLEEPLGATFSHGVAVAIAIAVSYLIVTAAHITVGEQVPKIYAITHAERTVRFVAAPLQWFRVLSRPLIWALNSASNWMLRLIGTDPRAGLEGTTSIEEFRLLLAESERGGHLDPGEASMLLGVFHLHEQKARQIMTPLSSVVTISVDDDIETALQRGIDSGHTRLVVLDRESDERTAGVAHANSLARLLLEHGPKASVRPAVKRPFIIPESRPLDDLLADLQRERQTMAIIADEYGRTLGIVTIEDIIEEVVGEIADETDPLTAPVRRLANGDWFARADVPLGDLRDHGLQLPTNSDSYNSLGGLVIDLLDRTPKLGDIARIDNYSLRVESVKGNAVEAVRIRYHKTPDGEN